jgi:hypothetical protein
VSVMLTNRRLLGRYTRRSCAGKELCGSGWRRASVDGEEGYKAFAVVDVPSVAELATDWDAALSSL